MSDSSISVSNVAPTVWGRVLRRLALFLSPLILVGLIAAGLMLRTGELLPASLVARLQTASQPFIYLTRFTDHTFGLKVEAVKLLEPEIIAMGSSRANQWRSAMFPISFYNGGNAFYTIDDFIAAFDAWDQTSPRLVIMTIDYFMFIDALATVADGKAKNDALTQKELAIAIQGVLRTATTHPWILFPDQREPIYGTPALGLNAMSIGTGSRIDGSYQYGHAMLDFQQVTVEQAVAIVADGDRWPLQGGDRMLPELRAKFETLANMARDRGIRIIGVTPPFAPDVVAALQVSPRHGAFREFRSPETAAWLVSLGIDYFDFSDLASIDGDPSEFIDPYHPSEPAYLRMLIRIASEPEIAGMLEVDTDYLASRLADATRLEVFRNEF